ncbi:hypothetical protein AB3N04_04680 [Alkalihalophilus sp. As8PL]|uniref:Uncharacterized protein n=1 Tax=Alkalihalophilus sp. As8PL TaxID=3237103 RepID=A0AB39BVL7_9BACI
MIVIYILGIIVVMLIAINLLSGLLAGFFGNHFISFFGRSYTKNPTSTFDRVLNVVFYAMHGVPYFFYVHFMKKHNYWKARLFYLLWLVIFVPICAIIMGSVGLFLETYTSI